MVVKVKAYRQKGISFRDIARILDKNVKNVYLWYKYGLKSYEQLDPIAKKKRK